MKYLIVNPGSTSKKYAFFDGEKEVFSAHLESEKGHFIAGILINDKKGQIKISEEDFNHPLKHIFDLLIANGFIEHKYDIKAVAIRIVCPGVSFLNNKALSGKYIKELEKAKSVAPLHVGPVLKEIKRFQKLLPEARLLGISDSEFHSNRPDVSKYYGIPKQDTEKYGLYKYGYHGISLSSILFQLKPFVKTLPSKIIICHLGGGASVTAVLNGKSIDTSMGFSPLEGVIMATRSGDIDPGALLHLMKVTGKNIEQMEDYLNHKCGLLGLSEESSDIRILLELEADGNMNAKLALETYVYKIKKYIGSYIAALNGVDLIVFSGTVGERSSAIRDRVCRDMGHLGIAIDKELNKRLVEQDGYVHIAGSKVNVIRLETNEVEEMARQVRKLL